MFNRRPAVGSRPGSDVPRAGARILSVFVSPLNVHVLRAHADGPQRLGSLRKKIQWFAEATVRDTIKSLCDIGALEKRSADDARNAVETALTPLGEEALTVAAALEDWLGQSSQGSLGIGDEQVKVAVKALAEGWNSTLTRELATGPRTLTELSSLIPEISYPALERRVTWMRTSGQISALPKETRGTPYTPTDWLRRSVAPLSIAGRCERRHMDDAPPITDVEVESAFLLALPLVRLPQTASGSCLLASGTDAATATGEGIGLAGVAIEVSMGEMTSVSVTVEGEPATWAIGTSDVWLDAVIDGRIERLRIGGARPQLGCDLVQGLHHALFTDR